MLFLTNKQPAVATVFLLEFINLFIIFLIANWCNTVSLSTVIVYLVHTSSKPLLRASAFPLCSASIIEILSGKSIAFNTFNVLSVEPSSIIFTYIFPEYFCSFIETNVSFIVLSAL